ncbi:hypothetical protein TDB9533_00184 [Thalassocella blandensis]|nr:hypothetical protein TDB9533_00184 [Thalassocella blandensis]
MAEPEPTNSVNDSTDKAHEVVIGCNELWSKSQEFSYIRLSDQQDDGTYKLVELYAARARRIAATYARFYLESEEGGNRDKKGRHYWMALGAFASKTVACLLDSFQVQSSYLGGFITNDNIDAREIAWGLAKGNLWLFSDIAPPHHFYNFHPEHFFNGMACIDKRDANNFVEPVKSNVLELRWSDIALPKINNFNASDDLKKGFEYTARIEVASSYSRKRTFQFEHLLAIADHEQGVVLQPLIYEDPNFAKWTARERQWWLSWAAPKYQLVFSHRCYLRDPDLKSEAPDDLIVEDFQSRMSWITNAAEQFHDLMDSKTDYMESELNRIAAWKSSPDALWVY